MIYYQAVYMSMAQLYKNSPRIKIHNGMGKVLCKIAPICALRY